MKKNTGIFLVFLLAITLLILVPACDTDLTDLTDLLNGNDNDTIDNRDIPSDPGTQPPPTAEGDLTPTFGVEVRDPENPHRIALNLGGLFNPETMEAITYSSDNLTVVEDGVVKGIKITPLGVDTTLKADIVFIIDTTGSMDPYINGVRNSVTAFLEFLHGEGVDVAAGALAYADGIPPDSNPAGIPAHDRGAWTVVDYTLLDTDLSPTGDTYTFVEELKASYLGYHGGAIPEGLFDSIYWAYENYNFRPGAQKIMIVLTDAPSWGKNASTTEIAPDCPWTDANMAEYFRGEVTIHVISTVLSWLGSGQYDAKYLAIPGGPNESPGTGGIWYEMAWGEEVDITGIPIGEVAVASALVEFVSADAYEEHTLRVVVHVNHEVNGEVTRTLRYID